MNITPQVQRNISVIAFSIIAVGAVYAAYANWHNIRNHKQVHLINADKLKKIENGEG